MHLDDPIEFRTLGLNLQFSLADFDSLLTDRYHRRVTPHMPVARSSITPRLAYEVAALFCSTPKKGVAVHINILKPSRTRS